MVFLIHMYPLTHTTTHQHPTMAAISIRKTTTTAVVVEGQSSSSLLSSSSWWSQKQSTTIRNQQSQSQQQQSQQQEQQLRRRQVVIKVACVGDSLTRGDIGINVTYGIDDYPTQLQQLLELSSSSSSSSNTNNVHDDTTTSTTTSAGVSYQVRNFGVNGATALNTVSASYTHTKEYQQIFEFHPNIVLLCLGTNDVKFLRSEELRQQYTQQTLDSFLSLIQNFYNTIETLSHVLLVHRVPYIAKDFPRIKQSNVELYLHPILDLVVQNITTWINENQKEQNQIQQQQHNQVQQRKLIFRTLNLMDVTKNHALLTTTNSNIYINDGLHFNHDGYELIARTWFDTYFVNLLNNSLAEEVYFDL